MKQFRIKIKGISPYMQHRMDDEKLDQWEKKRGKIMERPELSHDDSVRAEYHCYRDESGRCYIPSDQIRGSLIGGGSYMKAKVGGKSKSMKIIVAATFEPSEERIFIPDYDQVDKRSTINRNVKARVIVIRPKWSNWEAEFTLKVHEDTLTLQTIKELFSFAGQYVGIGSFRPTNNGLFGRFELISIELI